MLTPRAGRWAFIVVAAILAAALVVAYQVAIPHPGQAATDDAQDQARQIARAGYLFASSYSGEDLPANAAVAEHIAAAPGIHAVLASTVHNPDRRGVGVLAAVDVLLVGESRVAFGPAAERRTVCVRITVVREQTGPRDVRPELIDCPPGTATEIGE